MFEISKVNTIRLQSSCRTWEQYYLCIFQVSKRLLLLKKLDGYPIIREEDDQDEDDKAGAEGDSDDSDVDQ